MGRYPDHLLGPPRTTGAGAADRARPRGFRYSLPAFSFFISLAIVFVTVIAPDASAYAGSASAPVADGQTASGETESAIQRFAHRHEAPPTAVRDGYRVTKKPTAPAVGMPDPGTAKAIAWDLVAARGWGPGQYSCLVALWERESHWNVYAMNPRSGAYGIPQALPGRKMASAGSDWQTNPETQIRWGIGYIAARYATPCGAWDHSERRNWY